MPKIAYCIITGDKPQHVRGCIQNLIRVGPFVDVKIVVYDKLSEDNLNSIKEHNPFLIKLPFSQYPNGFRNAYINKAKELNCDYIFVCDSDELPNELLCSSLKSIVMNNSTINQFRVSQKYQLDGKENLDEGMLKPYSERFHKALIFKLEPWYQEPGAIEPVTKENPKVIDFEDWHILNLPEEYNFLHKKSFLDVWYGATRDWHLGQWMDVRDYRDKYNEYLQAIGEYNDFSVLNEQLIADTISPNLKQFIIENRSSEITDLRSYFCYYKHLHPELKDFSSTYTESRDKTIVEQAYLNVLYRHPDKDGLNHYSKLVNEGLSKEKLEQILKTSDEAIDLDINTNFVKYFGRIPFYLEFQVWNILLRTGIIASADEVFRALLECGSLVQTRVAYCQMCFKDNFDMAFDNAIKVKPYVDEIVIVYDQTLSIEQIRKLKENQFKFYYRKWRDNFVENRNYYLHIVRELSCGFTLVSDPDETFDEHFLKSLSLIIKNLNTGQNQKIGIIRIRPHDIWSDDDEGNPKNPPDVTIPTDYWKGLLLRVTPNLQYVGVGEMKNVHEDINTELDQTVLPDEFFYEHKKSHKQDIWSHAARNLYIGGSGDNLGKQNPHWNHLKAITGRLNLNTWSEFNNYLKGGNIDSELKELIRSWKDADCHKWDSEIRDTYKYYFKNLHEKEVAEK